MSTPPPRPSTLPIVALVLTIASACFPLLGLVGAIVGLFALRAARRDPQGRGRGMAKIAIVIGTVWFLVGTWAQITIALPAVHRYLGRARTAGARHDLDRLAAAVVAYHDGTSPRPDGTITLGRLPPSLPPTPAPGCEALPWPADAASGWRELGFTTDAPQPFSFSLEVARDGRSFTARATADLDCDGTRSRFELDGAVEGSAIHLAPMVVQDELE